jgi:hypothetical protein
MAIEPGNVNLAEFFIVCFNYLKENSFSGSHDGNGRPGPAPIGYPWRGVGAQTTAPWITIQYAPGCPSFHWPTPLRTDDCSWYADPAFRCSGYPDNIV